MSKQSSQFTFRAQSTQPLHPWLKRKERKKGGEGKGGEGRQGEEGRERSLLTERVQFQFSNLSVPRVEHSF